MGSSPTLGEPLASSQGAEKKAENGGNVNSFEKPRETLVAGEEGGVVQGQGRGWHSEDTVKLEKSSWGDTRQCQRETFSLIFPAFPAPT